MRDWDWECLPDKHGVSCPQGLSESRASAFLHITQRFKWGEWHQDAALQVPQGLQHCCFLLQDSATKATTLTPTALLLRPSSQFWILNLHGGPWEGAGSPGYAVINRWSGHLLSLHEHATPQHGMWQPWLGYWDGELVSKGWGGCFEGHTLPVPLRVITGVKTRNLELNGFMKPSVTLTSHTWRQNF